MLSRHYLHASRLIEIPFVNINEMTFQIKCLNLYKCHTNKLDKMILPSCRTTLLKYYGGVILKITKYSVRLRIQHPQGFWPIFSYLTRIFLIRIYISTPFLTISCWIHQFLSDHWSSVESIQGPKPGHYIRSIEKKRLRGRNRTLLI